MGLKPIVETRLVSASDLNIQSHLVDPLSATTIIGLLYKMKSVERKFEDLLA